MTEFMDVNDDPNVDLDSSRRSLLNNNDNLDCLPNLLSESAGEDYIPEADKLYIRRHSARKKSLRKSQRRSNTYKDYFKLFIPGVAAILFGILVYVIDPYTLISDVFLNLKEGSLLYNLWRKIPLKIYINVYVFNVTNGQRFIKGIDTKLKLEEVGPYVYSDQLTHNSVEVYNNNTLSFIGKHNFTFEPSRSIGDPTQDQIIVTNIALLGISSKLFNAQTAVILGLSSVISYTDAPPILNMTVQDYLWGYDEPLLKFGSKVLPSWLDFDRLGILDRMLDEGQNRITIHTEKEQRFKALKINGSPGLKDWGYNPNVDRGVCDRVNGTFDGILFSPNPPDRMFIYRRMFCRPIPIIKMGTGKTPNGIRVEEYAIAPDALDNNNPDNKCYCYNKAGCFPSGVTDLSPCYYGIPIGLSLPHFYGVNASLYSKLDGMKPNKERHTSNVQIQPNIGIPMFGKIPIQLNVVTRKSKYISRVKPFDNMIIPIFWAEVYLDGLPSYLNRLLWLLLNFTPIAQVVVTIVSIVGGMFLVFIANIRYAWSSKAWRRGISTRQRASIISYKIKQETRRLSTRSQHFIPLTNVDSPRARS